MNIHLRVSLMDKLEEWVEANCELATWPNAYLGSETTNLMADAAVTVFDAVIEIQEYGLAEGFYERIV